MTLISGWRKETRVVRKAAQKFAQSPWSAFMYIKTKPTAPGWLQTFIHSQPCSHLPFLLCGYRASSFPSQNSSSSFVRGGSVQSNPDKMGFLLFLMAVQTILKGYNLFARDLSFSPVCWGSSVTFYFEHCLSGEKKKQKTKKMKCQMWHLEVLL